MGSAGSGSLWVIDARTLIRVLAAARVLVGTAMTVAPRPAARGWIGGLARKPAVQLLARGLGVRDSAMGVGVLLTVDDIDAVRPWLAGCAVADAIDCAASLAARDELPRGSALAVPVVAAGSALAYGVLAAKLR